MTIKEVKALPDKSTVQSVRGIVEKQYPPADQTDNDKRFSQHRQSFLIVDESGEKLMVTLMKSSLHILDSIDGREMILSAGKNDKGELRGLLLNSWKKAGSAYDSMAVKVYAEATIRAVAPSGGEEQKTEAPTPQAQPQAQPVQSSGASDFEKELQLMAYGYCLCLDKSAQIVSDRPLLASDPESVRAIATNLWMSSKHKVHTLAPNLNGTNEVSKGVAPPKEAPKAPATPQDDSTTISRLIKGNEMRANDPESFSEKAEEALTKLVAIADRDDLWDQAYDTMLTSLLDESDNPVITQAAAADVYDETKATFGPKSKVEKFFVCGPKAWKASVKESENP